MNLKNRSLRVQLTLLKGVARRLFNNLFRPGYVKANLAKRTGECNRCGVCCQLGWRCSCFHTGEDLPLCRIHKLPRPPNCKAFPIDPRDLADRDLIAPPDVPCGYSWPKENQSASTSQAD